MKMPERDSFIFSGYVAYRQAMDEFEAAGDAAYRHLVDLFDSTPAANGEWPTWPSPYPPIYHISCNSPPEVDGPFAVQNKETILRCLSDSVLDRGWGIKRVRHGMFTVPELGAPVWACIAECSETA